MKFTKTKISVLIFAFVLILSLAACSSGGLAGTYEGESVNITIKFTGSDKCSWHESGMVFEGEYEKTDDGYILTIQGSGYIPTQEFAAYIDDKDLIVTVYGDEKRFIKQ